MLSRVGKTIGFFIFLFTIFLALSTSNASEKYIIAPEKPETHVKNIPDSTKPDASQVIASHLPTVTHILTSSPTELAEEAKYYVLGKVNSTVSSEAQKWLSQFGTVKINFGLDKKGKLENNSLDLLLPLYDNKFSWLLFSQLGYRNKDSRNTINLGLGGRYFDQNWMYGLNTFYDHDITGKNQRLGLGGEIWGNYIKFSTNAYYRLSGWRDSRNFQDYYERPANGYDINGEFFLPFYPNLGARLSYEQYFGDNITLFNRDTRQKNPSLAKIGLNYTPIPLMTLGVNYKQGESGHSETQFLANFTYRFGIPLSAQLAHNNVASMRTLAGSRYDLVERNNHIVLNHRKKEEQQKQLVLPPIKGYGHEEFTINLSQDASIQYANWYVTDKAFKTYNGKLSADSGKRVVITLPSYQEEHKEDYILYIEYTDNQSEKKTIHVPIKVLPFLVKGKIEITPSEIVKENIAYTLSDPVITYYSAPDNIIVKNGRIDNIAWTTEPALGEESGLSFAWNNQSAQTNEKGELINAKGQLLTNTLTSKKQHNNVDIYIQLDGAPRQKVGAVTFINNSPDYKVKEILVKPDGELMADGEQKYTYQALIVDSANNPLEKKKISNVKWVVKNPPEGLTLTASDGDVETDEKGQLTATLSSIRPADNIEVTLAIEEQPPVSAARKVSFKPEIVQLTIDSAGPKLVHDTYTYTVSYKAGRKVTWTLQNPVTGVTLKPLDDVTNENGEAKAELTSTVAAGNLIVVASADGYTQSATPVEFKWPIIPKPTYTPASGSVINDGSDAYTYTANVYELDGKTPYTRKDITFEWVLQSPTGDSTTHLLTTGAVSVNDQGELTDKLVSAHIPPVTDAIVCVVIAADKNTQQCADPTDFVVPYTLSLTVDHSSPQPEGEANKYTFTATVRGVKDEHPKRDIPIKWSTSLPIPDSNLITTQDDKTNEQGKATFTMYSKNGGFDNIKVTAAVDQSAPATANQTVSITAIPKVVDQVKLANYYMNTSLSIDPVPAELVSLGWEGFKFTLDNPKDGGTYATIFPAYTSDDNNIIDAKLGSTGPYFEVKKIGNTTVKARWTFNTGRYIEHKVDMKIKKMVFSDMKGAPNAASLGEVHPPDYRDYQKKTCTQGTPVQANDEIAKTIVQLVEKNADLRDAGLIGDPLGAYQSQITFVGTVDEEVGTVNEEYVQGYALSSKFLGVSANYIMICHY